MYINLKYFSFVCALILPLECVFSSSEEQASRLEHLSKQCHEAKHGMLNLNSDNYNNPSTNSYLFGCAVSVVIPSVNMVSGENKSNADRLAQKREKSKIADILLSKGIDASYKNEHGDTLLMLVIISFLPNEWKEETVKILIKKGVSISEKNSNGDTAMDLAKYRKNSNIIMILSQYDN